MSALSPETRDEFASITQLIDEMTNRVMEATLSEGEWIDAMRRSLVKAEAERDSLREQLRLAHEALTRWTEIHDLPAKEYTAKWGSVTLADVVDDFTDAARSALAGTVPLAQPQKEA